MPLRTRAGGLQVQGQSDKILIDFEVNPNIRPPPPIPRLYAIHHKILVVAISCKCQRVNPAGTCGGGKRCKEKHSNTTAHHPVVKPPAAASTAV